MRKSKLAVGVLGAVLVVGGALAAACGGDDEPSQDSGQANRQADIDPVARQIADLRAATSKYQKVEEALAAGYIADPVCIATPAGGMGIHYIKPALMDTKLVVEEPEILLYSAGPGGTLSLVAVEYFVPDADQNLATATDKPSLFGKQFDGPMEGHAPGMPMHYDLHVWLFKDNPAGMFAQWNPQVTCPQ